MEVEHGVYVESGDRKKRHRPRSSKAKKKVEVQSARDWWESVLKSAGEMGMSFSDLSEISPYEFHLMREGYIARMAAQWEQTRFISWNTYLTTFGLKRPKSIEEFMPLPGDAERLKRRKKLESGDKAAKKISDKQAEAINNLFK